MYEKKTMTQIGHRAKCYFTSMNNAWYLIIVPNMNKITFFLLCVVWDCESLVRYSHEWCGIVRVLDSVRYFCVVCGIVSVLDSIRYGWCGIVSFRFS